MRKKNTYFCLCVIIFLAIISSLNVYAEFTESSNEKYNYTYNTDNPSDIEQAMSNDSSLDLLENNPALFTTLTVLVVVANSVIFCVFVAAITFVIVTIIKHNRKPQKIYQQPTYKKIDGAPVLKNIREYHSIDPNFSESALKDELTNIYTKYVSSFQNKNIEDLRPCFTNNFYSKINRKVEILKNSKKTHHIENAAILAINIEGWRQDDHRDIITIKMRVKQTEYVTNDMNCEIVQNNKTTTNIITYEGDIVRTKGLTTEITNNLSVQNCPNCGASVNINQTAKCEYCGSIISSNTFNWAINSVKTLAKKSIST